jgi:hypothetical protein
MKTLKLSKANWKLLGNYNLTNGNEGNGFANTTQECDKLINISSFRNTYIKVKNTLFVVRYYDGCFYPCWFIPTFNNSSELENAINNAYIINKPLTNENTI